MSLLGGSVGAALHRLARGIDDRPVAERAEAKQISAETTYESDIVTLAQLHPAIEAMAAAAHRRLIADGRAARTVVLKLKKADMSIVTRSFTLPYATEELATLTAAALRSAIDPGELGPIRLVGVGFGGLSTVRQESLFPELDQALAASGRPGAAREPDSASALDEFVAPEPTVAAGSRPPPAPSPPNSGIPAAMSPTASTGTAGCRVPDTAVSRCVSRHARQDRVRRIPFTPTMSTSPRPTRSLVFVEFRRVA